MHVLGSAGVRISTYTWGKSPTPQKKQKPQECTSFNNKQVRVGWVFCVGVLVLVVTVCIISAPREKVLKDCPVFSSCIASVYCCFLCVCDWHEGVMSIVGKPENFPSAVILTFGNKAVLYCTVILPLVAERSQTRRHGVGDQEVAAGHQFFWRCWLWRIILSTRMGAALNFGSRMLLLGIHVFLCTITPGLWLCYQVHTQLWCVQFPERKIISGEWLTANVVTSLV